MPVFGRFELQPERRRLLQDGNPVAIGARAFDVLLALAERRERIVTKAELLDLAWPDLVVEENNLQVQISTLRKLLGPGAISTIPGRGYRFVASADVGREVHTGEEPVSEADSSQSSPVPSSNVPIEDGPLLGRAADLVAVEELLGEHRLVSIVGAGGIGKTRLAQSLARRNTGKFRHGVRWVELTSVGDPLQVVTAIATAAGISLDGTKDTRASLVARLNQLEMLFVLDNCEHVLQEVAALLPLALGSLDGVHWLVTSAAPLGIAGECVPPGHVGSTSFEHPIGTCVGLRFGSTA